MRLPICTVSFVLVTAALLPVSAQTPAPSAPVKLETLRVTADLWESPLTHIPASVSVYDEAALRAGNIQHFGDLVDQVPNLTWTGGTSRPRYLQIRGIGENSQYEGETPDSTVRFLVDDLDFTGLGTVGTAFDVGQVEVLRGPQAGAFGANAAGGVVRLVTRAPTPFWTGSAEAGFGGDALRFAQFAVGGPLLKRPEELMMRFAVQQSSQDGFRHNLTQNRATNERDEFTARLRLVWNPNDYWRWESTFLAATFDNGFDEYALDNNGKWTYSDQPGRDEQRSLAASLRGVYTAWEGVRLTTTTTGSRTRSRYSYDDDWTASSYQGFSDLSRTRWGASQEVRLDSDSESAEGRGISRWTTGVFYANTDERSRYTNEDPGNVRGLRTVYDADQFAWFGQIGHDFTARTRLVLGLRSERVESKGEGTRTRYRASTGRFDPVVVVYPKFSDNVFGGKVTLEHDLSDHEFAFLSVTRGYKAGGINVDARIDPSVDPLVYDTETLWNYEAGVRGHWWESRLTGEVTAFYLARSNTQVRDSAGFGGSYRFFTDNANEAYVYGAEMSGAYAISERWSVRGSLGLMQSELESFVVADGRTVQARELANTPRTGYTVGVRYGAETGLFFSSDLVGKSKQYDSNNQNEARRSYQVVNANLGYRWRHWTVTLWAKNAFDEVYDKRVLFFGNEDPDYLEKRYENRADPRQIGVTVGYQF
ncbi:MAG TPA: TonB-dependent receptor [Opitutaceae bacterium]|nr:TonB-dependent receptor [Opitutaceae bacterium]